MARYARWTGVSGLIWSMEEDKTKEQQLDEVLANSKDKVRLGRHTIKVGWIHNAAKRKVTHILESEKDEAKVVAKCAAALVLDRRPLIWLLFWFVWRWFYYVEEFTEEEMLPFIMLCKKKVDATTYFVCMACLNDMRDNLKKMNRTDAGRILPARK